MKIGIIGSGMVGRAFSIRLAELGHDVLIGTRNPIITLGREEPDSKGIPAWKFWSLHNPEIKLATFQEVADFGDVIINATAGAISIEALSKIEKDSLKDKVILDLALPLSYSPERSPKLIYSNEDSLGEKIQRAFPESKVVKTLNTMSYKVMLYPSLLPRQHNAFISGDSEEAKLIIAKIMEGFGWESKDIIDLGGIITARTTEMYAPLLFQLSKIKGHYNINISVVSK
ncbi:NADPH-dependent F420 reductase [Rosenbergiella epipactidis]|uniref:NADPH-dependent F420 reductase n=1 Tax=Rosenbergiella epipactidis TaxID=1544694 RepID=UPI001F4DE3C7|nr:NAD(P)-binding domain-containing protein [Rosenbergiella epipactidis]